MDREARDLRASPVSACFISHSLQLEDLYVSPEHRNLGVGKALFTKLGEIAEEKVYNACP